MTTATPNAPWHALLQLTELPGPQWRLPPQQGNDLRLVRAFEHYVETVCVDGDVVAVNRQPITGRCPQTIVTANFAGSIDEAMGFLRQPPHWQREVQRPTVQQVQWP